MTQIPLVVPFFTLGEPVHLAVLAFSGLDRADPTPPGRSAFNCNALVRRDGDGPTSLRVATASPGTPIETETTPDRIWPEMSLTTTVITRSGTCRGGDWPRPELPR